jgi:hypothetical protein
MWSLVILYTLIGLGVGIMQIRNPEDFELPRENNQHIFTAISSMLSGLIFLVYFVYKIGPFDLILSIINNIITESWDEVFIDFIKGWIFLFLREIINKFSTTIMIYSNF